MHHPLEIKIDLHWQLVKPIITIKTATLSHVEKKKTNNSNNDIHSASVQALDNKNDGTKKL